MTAACVEDLRLAAKRRLPKIFFDYIDGGSFGEQTAASNVRDFDSWLLEQRVLTDVSTRDLSTTFVGREYKLPFMLGPVGFSGLFAAKGEVQAAKAAHAAGIAFCLSNFGIVALEALRAATTGPLWFQLYLLKDQTLSESFIRRAENVRVEALCVTIDCALGGVRERDVRSGFRSLRKVTPRLVFSLASRPRWCLSVVRSGFPRIGNLADRPEFRGGLLEQAARLSGQIDPSTTWDGIKRLRDRWKGQLVLKGIMNPDDAEQAARVGANAIVISNHGGRELDGAPSTISVLPQIAAAVGTRLDVLLDGGVRRGSQIVKALALGAKGVLLGRSYAFGLAAYGERGVAQVIRMLATELEVTMALMGVTRVPDLFARRNELLRPRQIHEVLRGE